MGENLAKIPLDVRFRKLNNVFAFFIAAMPPLLLILNIIVPNLGMRRLFLVWCIMYIIVFLVFAPANIKYIKLARYKSKLLKTALALSLALYSLVVISMVVTQTFVHNSLEMLCYPLLFVCVLFLDKKYLKIFFQILLASIVFSAFLGIIDPFQTWVPGFQPCAFQMASFFWHCNYSACVVAITAIVVANLIVFCKKNKLTILYSAYFAILSVFLYFGSTFTSITVVYATIVFELIFFSIKNKHFNWAFFTIFVSFVAICLLLELVPITHQILSKNNYFVECIAVFDNIFHTNLLQSLFHIDFIEGADGWERKELFAQSLKLALGGEKTTFFGKLLVILFGVGGGTVNVSRPHNLFLGVWLDFGLLASLVNMTIIVLLLIYMIKQNKQNLPKISPFFFACTAYLFITLLGSLIVYHYIYFVTILALGTKISYQTCHKVVAITPTIKQKTNRYVEIKNKPLKIPHLSLRKKLIIKKRSLAE